MPENEARENASLRKVVASTRLEVRNWFSVWFLGCLVSSNRFLINNPLTDSWLGRRPLTIRLRSGIRLRCLANEIGPFFEVFCLGEYEFPGLDWSRVATIVDVGANVGIATIWMAGNAPSARVVAVEPSPAIDRLRENLAINNLEARTTVVHAAAGEVDGWARLEKRASVHVGANAISGSVVRAVCLETLLEEQELSRINLLKIDCEGAEYAFFAAPRQALERVDAIVGEYHDVVGHSPQEIVALLELAGFRVDLGAPRTSNRGPVGQFWATRL